MVAPSPIRVGNCCRTYDYEQRKEIPNMALEKIDIDTLDPARTIVVATGNAHKLVEIEAILGQVLPRVRFVALGQLGDFEDPEENGATFLENALIKAEAAVEVTGLAAIADDSGLVVDALNGEPGVYSARYAGVHGDDAANNAKLLAALADVPDSERTARFMSVVALIDADGFVRTGTGACEGAVAHEGRGEHGFGYDPLFLPADTPGKTMAELAPEEKNAISHRFHALVDLSAQLSASGAGFAGDVEDASAEAAETRDSRGADAVEDSASDSCCVTASDTVASSDVSAASSNVSAEAEGR